jgi:undecaprenyl-diphosphatase
VSQIDVRLFFAIHHALSGWIAPLAVLSAIGGGWGALVLFPLLAAQRTRRMAQSLAGVLVITTLLVFGLKFLFARARPCACLDGVHALVFAQPTDFSFPSGHAAGSFAFAVFIAMTLVKSPTPSRWLGAIALILFALGVALSRIALGVHFPGDVFAGAILGSTVAVIGAKKLESPVI